MKFVNYTSVTFFILLLSSCGLSDRTKFTISIKNNSNKSLYFTYSFTYPDTSVDNSQYIPKGSTRTPSVVVDPGQLANIIISRVSLDEFYDQIPSGKFEVLVYDANVVKNTPWDTVVAKYLVLKRYELTSGDVTRTNGKISYP